MTDTKVVEEEPLRFLQPCLEIPLMAVLWTGVASGVTRTRVILDFLKQELWKKMSINVE